MNATEFVAKLAPLINMAVAELKTVDMSLASAGLREKSRGRHIPEITRIEAIRLLLGAAVGGNRTQAAAAVRDRERFTLMPLYSHDNKGETLRHYLGFDPTEAHDLGLVPALSALCAHLAAGGGDGAYIGVAVTDDMVLIEIDNHDPETQFRAELQFTGAVDYAGRRGIETTRTIRQHVLKWIGEVTV
jgi:hypothetical protein